MGVWIKQRSNSGAEVLVTDNPTDYIFKGRAFSSKIVVANLTVGKHYILFKSNGNDTVIIPPSFSITTGPLIVSYYTGGNYTGGTALHKFNRNFISDNTCLCTLTKDATGSDEGDQVGQLLIGSAAGPASKTGGGHKTDDDIVILGEGEQLLFEIDNVSGATIDYFGYRITWYE